MCNALTMPSTLGDGFLKAYYNYCSSNKKSYIAPQSLGHFGNFMETASFAANGKASHFLCSVCILCKISLALGRMGDYSNGWVNAQEWWSNGIWAVSYSKWAVILPQITYSPSTGYYCKTTMDNPRKWHIGDKLKGKQ